MSNATCMDSPVASVTDRRHKFLDADIRKGPDDLLQPALRSPAYPHDLVADLRRQRLVGDSARKPGQLARLVHAWFHGTSIRVIPAGSNIPARCGEIRPCTRSLR